MKLTKLTRNLIVAGSISAVAAIPAAYADGGTEPEITPAVEEPAEIPVEDVVIEEGETPVDEGVVVVEEGEAGGGPEVVVCEPVEGGGEVVELEIVSEGEPVELVDPAVCEMTGWEPGGPEVQRGEDRGLENPDVIFYNTAVDTPGSGAPMTKAAAEFANDERAADIQSKAAGAAEVKKEKKGPVALIQKGRVFLR